MKSLVCLLFAIVILLILGAVWAHVRDLFPDLTGFFFVITSIWLANYIDALMGSCSNKG